MLAQSQQPKLPLPDLPALGSYRQRPATSQRCTLIVDPLFVSSSGQRT
jgi:hypothetical protein